MMQYSNAAHVLCYSIQTLLIQFHFIWTTTAQVHGTSNSRCQHRQAHLLAISPWCTSNSAIVAAAGSSTTIHPSVMFRSFNPRTSRGGGAAAGMPPSCSLQPILGSFLSPHPRMHWDTSLVVFSEPYWLTQWLRLWQTSLDPCFSHALTLVWLLHQAFERMPENLDQLPWCYLALFAYCLLVAACMTPGFLLPYTGPRCGTIYTSRPGARGGP